MKFSNQDIAHILDLSTDFLAEPGANKENLKEHLEAIANRERTTEAEAQAHLHFINQLVDELVRVKKEPINDTNKAREQAREAWNRNVTRFKEADRNLLRRIGAVIVALVIIAAISIGIYAGLGIVGAVFIGLSGAVVLPAILKGIELALKSPLKDKKTAKNLEYLIVISDLSTSHSAQEYSQNDIQTNDQVENRVLHDALESQDHHTDNRSLSNPVDHHSMRQHHLHFFDKARTNSNQTAESPTETDSNRPPQNH